MEACGSVAEEENESWLCVAQSVTLHASAGRAGGPLVRQARLAALLETPDRVRALQEGVRRLSGARPPSCLLLQWAARAYGLTA